MINGKVMYGDHRDTIGIIEPQGHAVMQLYLLSGITDIYIETGEQILLDTVRNTWDDMTTRKMAITGGVGVRQKSEAFGASYEIPNEATCNETCDISAEVAGWEVSLHVDTNYPWDGRVRLEVKAASSGEATCWAAQ